LDHKKAGAQWAFGSGLGRESLTQLGAIDLDSLASHVAQGFEVIPTFFVVDRSGSVRWTDQGARLKHEDPEQLLRRLATQVQLVLSEHEVPSK